MGTKQRIQQMQEEKHKAEKAKENMLLSGDVKVMVHLFVCLLTQYSYASH